MSCICIHLSVLCYSVLYYGIKRNMVVLLVTAAFAVAVDAALDTVAGGILFQQHHMHLSVLHYVQ